MITAKKLLSLTLGFALVLAHVFTLLTVAKPVQAAYMQGAKVSLSESRPATSSNHSIYFTGTTATPALQIRVKYSTGPNNTGLPTASMLDSIAKPAAFTNLTVADWTLDVTAIADGVVKYTHATGVNLLAAGSVIIGLDGVVNSALTACDATASSDTCFVQIQTSTADGAWDTNVIDEATATYTVNAGVTVSATVDPSFTFVITAVNSGTAVDGVNTTITSTTSTLPFGNLTVGTPAYSAHQLNVTTNANSGYNVTLKLQTQMTGTYAGNNIDGFAGSSASYADPKVWEEPTGTAKNVDSGWFGYDTTDTDIAAFAAGEFAPVEATAQIVMSNTGPDLGTTAVNVLYALEANVYQPADVYTGLVLYTATPTY